MCVTFILVLAGTAQASDPQSCTIPYATPDPVLGLQLEIGEADHSNHDFRECPSLTVGGHQIPGDYWMVQVGGKLDGANFNDLDLHGISFAFADLSGSQFVGTNLAGATFRGSEFYTPDVPDAPDGELKTRCNGLLTAGTIHHLGLCLMPRFAWERLTRDGAWITSLDDADFSKSVMRNAYLSQVSADGTTFPDLLGVRIERSDLSGAHFAPDAKIIYYHYLQSADIQFPASIRLLCGRSVVRICTRINPNLQLDAILASIVDVAKSKGSPDDVARKIADDFFRSADLAGMDLSGSDIGGVDLTGASAGEAAPSSKIRAAAASTRGTKFRNASLQGATLTGVKFRAADLRGVRSGKIRGRAKSLPSGWKIIGGYLVGHYANLAGANLMSANLRGADLRATNLQGAQLGHARLSGVRSGGITGKPKSLPPGWRLVKGSLKKR